VAAHKYPQGGPVPARRRKSCLPAGGDAADPILKERLVAESGKLHIRLHSPGDVFPVAHGLQALPAGDAARYARGIDHHSGVDPLLTDPNHPAAALQFGLLDGAGKEGHAGVLGQGEVIVVELLAVQKVARSGDSHRQAGGADDLHALQLVLDVAVIDIDACGPGHSLEEGIGGAHCSPEICVSQDHICSLLGGGDGGIEAGSRGSGDQDIAVHRRWWNGG